MTKRNTILALVATGLLALTAVAVPVSAEDADDDQAQQDRREAAKQQMEQRREAAQHQAEQRREAAKDAKEAWKEACRDDLEDNATLNETQQRRCMAVKEFGEHAFKARRESHALLGAIEAIERRIGRLEVKEIQLQAELDSGNFTGNHTAESVAEDIAKIQEHQERMVERLEALKLRLDALHEKWVAVRDHVESRRHGGDDDEDDEEESESESESDSSSSSSSSSSAAA